MTAWASGAWAAGAWTGTAWQSSASVTVPDVVGLAQADAVAALEGAGFVVSIATAASSSVPSGSVISQAPAGGSEASPGSTVTITVSAGDSVATDPKLIAGPRRYKNVGFKAAKRKEPPAPIEPKAKASGLLKGLMSRLSAPPALATGLEIPPQPVAIELPPVVLAEPAAEAQPAAVDPMQAVLRRLDALEAEMRELRAKVADPLPMPALRDPLDDALAAILPALREPIAPDEPEGPAGLPELDEDELRELSGEAPQPVEPAAPAPPAIDKKAENRRRAEILASKLL